MGNAYVENDRDRKAEPGSAFYTSYQKKCGQ